MEVKTPLTIPGKRTWHEDDPPPADAVCAVCRQPILEGAWVEYNRKGRLACGECFMRQRNGSAGRGHEVSDLDEPNPWDTVTASTHERAAAVVSAIVRSMARRERLVVLQGRLLARAITDGMPEDAARDLYHRVVTVDAERGREVVGFDQFLPRREVFYVCGVCGRQNTSLPSREDELKDDVEVGGVHGIVCPQCEQWPLGEPDEHDVLEWYCWDRWETVWPSPIVGRAYVVPTELYDVHVADYQTYLTTAHWLEIREYVKTRAGGRCQICNATDRLDTHHRTYERRGFEWPMDLVALCRDCHAKHHNKPRGNGRGA